MRSRFILLSALGTLTVTGPWVSLQALEPAKQFPAERLDSSVPSESTEKNTAKPQWRLLGVVLVPDSKPRVLLRDLEEGNTRYIEEGAETRGWLIKDVQADKVVLFNKAGNEEWVLRSYQSGAPSREKPIRQVQPESQKPSKESAAARLQRALSESGTETADTTLSREVPESNAANRLQRALNNDPAVEGEEPLPDSTPSSGESATIRLQRALEERSE